jgi:chromosome condensin MukBEF complex kleisin-like MukF subunit
VPTEVLTELLKLGILGPIVVSIGWFCWQQHKTIEKLHTSQALATQQHIDRLLQLNTAWQEVLSANAELLSSTVTTLGSVRETLQNVNDTLKEVTRQQYALIAALRSEDR